LSTRSKNGATWPRGAAPGVRTAGRDRLAAEQQAPSSGSRVPGAARGVVGADGRRLAFTDADLPRPRGVPANQRLSSPTDRPRGAACRWAMPRPPAASDSAARAFPADGAGWRRCFVRELPVARFVTRGSRRLRPACSASAPATAPVEVKGDDGSRAWPRASTRRRSACRPGRGAETRARLRLVDSLAADACEGARAGSREAGEGPASPRRWRVESSTPRRAAARGAVEPQPPARSPSQTWGAPPPRRPAPRIGPRASVLPCDLRLLRALLRNCSERRDDTGRHPVEASVESLAGAGPVCGSDR
jgi:hypothetical protein